MQVISRVLIPHTWFIPSTRPPIQVFSFFFLSPASPCLSTLVDMQSLPAKVRCRACHKHVLWLAHYSSATAHPSCEMAVLVTQMCLSSLMIACVMRALASGVKVELQKSPCNQFLCKFLAGLPICVCLFLTSRCMGMWTLAIGVNDP